MKLSIVFTCYNRIEKTRNCILSLQQSLNSYHEKLETKFFVCDDASNDGTIDMLRALGNNIEIIVGDGNLFWAKGMAAALDVAEKRTTDFFLMVNDDVEFYENVIPIMFEKMNSCEKPTVIVGATQSKDDGSFSYGGHWWNGKAIGKTITPVPPDTKSDMCNLANWNCILIPKEIYYTVGQIDRKYEHSFADFDYSNRVVAAGFEMRVAGKYIGRCDRNFNKNTWRDKELSIQKRITLLHKPNGFPPKSSWRYARKYYGWAAPVLFLQPYFSIVINAVRKKVLCKRGK
ncbi:MULTISPECIES: glycosyltransferase [Clostridia]|jgi:GT2 family glycosyltransferase|uniref:glycosyltransferase family 2 protein n=1 Tax=Clostridia TaxID=186801 RepID=UPI0015FDC3D3|nr:MULTISPECIES: glycosyltransferase [Clostridia]